MKIIKLIILANLGWFSLVAYAGESMSAGFDSVQALQQLQRLAQSAPAGAPSLSQPGGQQTSPASANKAQQKNNSAGNAGGKAEIPLLNQTAKEDEAVREAAFRQAIQDSFPLTPEQLLRYRQMHDLLDYVQSTEAKTPPKPIASSQFIHLAPGSTPPVVRLSQGFVTSIVFLDSSGAPWPIVAYDLGNPEAFNIQWDRTSNILMIQATKQYTYGNMALRLDGLNTPVMLTLVPGQKVVDYRVDMRVQGSGPNAKPLAGGLGIPPSADPILLSVLDGIAPPNSKVVDVIGGDAQAWLQDTRLFLRTRLTVLSPAWIAKMRSADGMHVYELPKAPVLLAAQNGKIVNLKIERM